MRGFVSLTLALGLALLLVQSGSGQVTQEWARRINFGDAVGNDNIKGLAVDSQGNVFVGGTASSLVPRMPHRFVVVKNAPNGDRVWIGQYPGPNHTGCIAQDFVLDASGNTYLTGGHQPDSPAGPTDYLTVKFDPSGEVMWAATYDGPGQYFDNAEAIAVDDSGNVYVTGNASVVPVIPYEGEDYGTIKYNAQGVQQWVALYDGPLHSIDRAYDVAVDAQGDVYVLGSSVIDTVTGNSDMVTVKYNPQGIQQWEARLLNSGNPSMLLVDDQSNVFVSGQMAGAGSSDMAVAKYNSDGVQQWLAQYSYPGNESVSAIALDADGNIIATGSTNSGLSNKTITLKYNANGSLIWMRQYVSDSNGGYGLALDAEQNIYVTGYTGWGYSHCLTLKYSPQGDLLWSTIFNDHNNCSLGGYVALDAEGNVLVAGSCAIIHNPEAGQDFLTIKYSQDPARTVQGKGCQSIPSPSTFSFVSSPNPFNPSTAISYQLPADSHVSLKVYDTAGRLVETLVDGWRAAGTHELTLNAGDLASGMYFAKLEAGEYVGVQKMVLLK